LEVVNSVWKWSVAVNSGDKTWLIVIRLLQHRPYLNPIPCLQHRWCGVKKEYGIKCHLSVETLTGGRIRCIDHMTELLSNHSEFNWENDGVEWEIDHVTPFELMNKDLVSDRFKLNNWRNLAPKTSEQNKKERYLKLDAAHTAQTKAASSAVTEESESQWW
jgi:hypothetical protein